MNVVILTVEGRPTFDDTLASVKATLPAEVPLHIFSSDGGVVNASCMAIKNYMTDAGMILLQDDILMTANWYKNLLVEADLVAGMTLTSGFPYTAQCLYLSKKLYDTCFEWFNAWHNETSNFDGMLFNMAAEKGLKIELISPAVCQHIGVVSLVRVNRPWRTPKGKYRITYDLLDPLINPNCPA